MYCIYVSIKGQNIQKVIDDSNNIVMSNNVQSLIPLARDIRNKYPNLNVSIVNEDINSIEMDFQ